MVNSSKNLTINTNIDPINADPSKEHSVLVTPGTESSTPHNLDSTRLRTSHTPATPINVRGRSDLRSPGISKTPTIDHPNANYNLTRTPAHNGANDDVPMPDFITQTDRYGNASTPRNPISNTDANNNVVIQESNTDETEKDSVPQEVQVDDACDTLLESLRMMCCCILPEPVDNKKDKEAYNNSQLKTYPYTNDANATTTSPNGSIISPKQIVKEDVVGSHDIRLLPEVKRGDKCFGKKCLVLDLDETLVHSSFRAVPGADFVIPVQIEDIVHFVYVMKRPGVDEFLIEMAKHYEIVVYTASLNKYADPLLDLLDPQQTIKYRLFRESCVFYEGSYVKDLSLLNRDLSQTIIIDNSPASYIFHPENAIDCSSFIDDPADRELLQIGSFLKGIKNVDNVRGLSNMWKEWPRIPRMPKIDFPVGYEEDREFAEMGYANGNGNLLSTAPGDC